MSKHTPGKWVAVGAWVEHPNDSVPDICSGFVEQGTTRRTYDEAMANAFLMAAAPELLKVARLVIKAHPLQCGNGDSAALIMAAHAAIAKATNKHIKVTRKQSKTTGK